jgi:LmbE family N-acetylglucosaminyl deacetylase
MYVFPHPDDESFGPAHAMAKQRREGHEVYLLTLTKGGATKQRHRFGYSIEEMGEVRLKEMWEMARVLDLSGMTVLDLPDSGLKEMDPRDIERITADEMKRVQPEVVVSYPVHGISGFHDHLVMHAVVKRVFLELRSSENYLRRLAFHTLTEADAAQSPHFRLNFSRADEIDCVLEVDDCDVEKKIAALDCYVTYEQQIEQSGVKRFISKSVPFEFFQEGFDPPVSDVFASLPVQGNGTA